MQSQAEADDEARIAALIRLKGDFPLYAAEALKIKSKDAKLVPFAMNRAQRYLHTRLEEQREAIGKVRAIVLKGRQQGASTYIGGRFYWRASLNRGLRVFILTHEQTATDSLFDMVERFHKNTPLRPSTGAANAKELYFDKLDGGYEVGTAGSKAIGRSKTLQLLHGSEVAFWPNAAGHFAGVVQAVPDLPGTEIILESTAFGVGGEFHERWQQAEAGIGDYIAVFIPWFWQDEYRREVPEEGFQLNEEEAEYAEMHGLELEQMAWRRAKLAEFKDPLRFKQEYPATAAEAFQTTGHDSYIKPEAVLKARKTYCTGFGPMVGGADPARFGDDRFAIAIRQGRKVHKIEAKQGLDTIQGAMFCKQAIDKHGLVRLFVDVGGLGAGTVDVLHSWGKPYDKVVIPVNFGSAPFEPNPTDDEGRDMGGYLNRRAEMWGNSRDWLSEAAGVDLPDLDSLQADACGPKYRYDTAQRVILESKEDMRKRKVRSPDLWDAVALTFAEPVNEPTAPARLVIPDYGAA